MRPHVASQAEGHDWKQEDFRCRPLIFSISVNCTSIQSSNVTEHISKEHGKITDTKLAAVQEQETSFKAAVASMYGQQGSIRSMMVISVSSA